MIIFKVFKKNCLFIIFDNKFQGTNVGSLQIKAIRNTPNNDDFNLNNSLSIFTINGTQVQKWIQKSVRLEPEDIDYDFKLAIDGIVGSGYAGINE